MAVKVIEPAQKRVRCQCGALLGYGTTDVKRVASGARVTTNPATNGGGWPWIPCPECHRAGLVAGVF